MPRPPLRGRLVGQRDAARAGALLHALVVLEAEPLALLRRAQAAHARAVLVALLLRHQLPAVDVALRLVAGLVTQLIARLIAVLRQRKKRK